MTETTVVKTQAPRLLSLPTLTGYSLLLGLAGCSHQLSGPAPSVTTAATPHLVCDQQLTTRVGVMGSGFSPMPIDTAKDPAHLKLPALVLQRTSDLSGTATASDMPVPIPDSPTDTATSQVHWMSQMAMAFDVTPALALADGVYELGVTNPNGNATSAAAALVAVPPPTLTAVEPMAVCDAQHAVTLTLHGSGFLNVSGTLPTVALSDGTTMKTYTPTNPTGCVALPAPATESMTCTGLVITVPMGDLPPGTYSVVVTNPAPAACHSTASLTVEVVPPPDLTSIAPTRICTGGGTIGLMGTGFRSPASVTVGTLAAGNVTVAAGGMNATATFGVGLDPGTYDVTITNPEGCFDTLTSAVQVVEGPILFWVDPNVIYNGITTQVTLYASGITPSSTIDSVTITPSAGGTAVPLTFSVDPRGRIQAVVPTGTAAGTYTVAISTAGCAATLPDGMRIVDATNLTLDRIEPTFGWQGAPTAMTIFGGGFVSTPRVYLNPHSPTAGTVATELLSVGFVDATRLTALVPAGLPVGTYDVLVVNPTGEVGLINDVNADFHVTTNPPPVIDTVSPQQLDAGGVRTLAVGGSGFATPSAAWRCRSGTTPAGTVGASTATTSSVTVDTTALAAGDVCVLRLTNPDGSYGDFSAIAITTPASNIQAFTAATAMTTARRGLGLVAGRPTNAARFLYALGGDSGMTSGALATSESASVDVFGAVGPWFAQPYGLPGARALPGAVRLGRFLYLVGGHDGTHSVPNVHRAEVLDPLDAPVITDLSARRGMGTGLGAGVWYFRVSAVFGPTDARNPDGESLPSDPLAVQLPTGLPDTLLLSIDWSDVTGAVAYRIYRSPTASAAPGSEQLVATVAAPTHTYEDTGAAPTMAVGPLPLGAYGKWATMPSLTTARSAAGVGIATDPATPTIHYLYAVGGRDATGTALRTYEYLPVTVVDDHTQTVGTWTAGAATAQLGTARAELGLFVADNLAAPRVAAGQTILYAGPGTATNGTAVTDVDAAQVLPGGQLAEPSVAPAVLAWTSVDSGRNLYGYAFAAGNDFLYTFGGGPAASTTCVSAEVCGAGQTCAGGPPDPPDLRNWNNEGISLTAPRYLPGSTVESSFVFVAGGASGGTALATTEQTVL